MSDFKSRLASMPPDRQRCTLQILPRKLATAGQAERFHRLLTDFNFIEAKVSALGPQPLLEDYDLARNTDLLLFGYKADTLRLIQGALRLSENILTKDRTQLTEQLLGRLMSCELPEIQAMLEQATQGKATPWLRHLTPTLTPPGGLLVRTLPKNVGRVVLTPDSLSAISGSKDGTLKFWDLVTGNEIRTLKESGGMVYPVAITPNGQMLISGSQGNDRTLKAWDLATDTVLHTLNCYTGSVIVIAVTPDGKLVISASNDYDLWDNTLKVWDLATDTVLYTLSGHSCRVTAVAVTPDGKLAISASAGLEYDNSLRVWDLATGKELRTFGEPQQQIFALAITPDGQRVIAADRYWLTVWDLATGNKIRNLRGHTRIVNAVAVTSDSRIAISASTDTTLKVWDLTTGKELRTLQGHTRSVDGVAITPDGRFAISNSDDLTRKIWDLASPPPLPTVPGHNRRVTAVAITQDDQKAISASWDGTLKIWNLATGIELSILQGYNRFSATDKYIPEYFQKNLAILTAVAITSDSQTLIAGSYEKLQFWNLATGDFLGIIKAHPDARVNAVAVTPDGRMMISASNGIFSRDRRTAIRDILHNTSDEALIPASQEQMDFFASMDNVPMDWNYDNTLKVWDLATCKVLHTLCGHANNVKTVAITPDSQKAISADEGGILKVWELASGKELRTLQGHTDKINAVAITPNGQMVISASGDATLKVWNLATGKELCTLQGHTDEINALAISPFGQMVISTSDDGTLKIWDLEKERVIASFSEDSRLHSCAFAPDGVTIVVGDESGKVHFLRLEGVEKTPDFVLKFLPYPQFAVIELCGKLEENNASEEFRRQAEEVLSSKQTSILLLDLSQLQFICASGLGKLPLVLKFARQQNKQLYLCSLQKAVKFLFELTSMDILFKIFESRAAFEAEVAKLEGNDFPKG